MQSAEQAAFSREDIIFLQTMADQLANAIENAHLYEQAQQEIVERKRAEEELLKALERTESLYRIGDAIATITDQQTTFETVLGEYLRLLRLTPAHGGIMLFNHAKGYSRVEVLCIDGNAMAPDLTISSEQDLIGQDLLEHPTPLVIKDIHTHPLTKDTPEIWQQVDNVEAMLLLPMIMRGTAVGAIIAISVEKGGDFSQSDIEIGQVVTDQLAIWLENRHLLAEAQYRSDHLQTAAEVSGAANSILDADELINTSVNLIRDQFGFYYVGLFLVDEAREWAILRAGTGEAGLIQLKRNHRLKIGGESMIGWSIQNRKARIALDVGQEAVHFRNPILPDTHSEMALPLVSRDEAIGALTVQSEERGAFSDEDVTLLQTMTDQLANAISNARLYEASQRRARREALIKEITTKVRASTDLDTILQTTIKEIGDAISSKRAYIHLVSPEGTNGNAKSDVEVEGMGKEG
jgi:GAF domain-containing protein